MKVEKTEGFEISAYKIQTQGNYPEESVQDFILRLPVSNRSVAFSMQ
jgi:hypothetical protein